MGDRGLTFDVFSMGSGPGCLLTLAGDIASYA